MSLIKRNGNMLNAMPGLFDDFFSRDLFDWTAGNFSNSGTTLPAVNIKETGENFEVEMAAPGMQKENFEVMLDGNLLTISASNQDQQLDDDDNKYSRKEFQYQSFQRRFTLPKDVVEVNKIEARYDNGLLKLVIPKREEAKKKPPRMINIS